MKDEIVEEVRAAREAYAARFNYDLAEMFNDLKAKEHARNPQYRRPSVTVTCPAILWRTLQRAAANFSSPSGRGLKPTAAR